MTPFAGPLIEMCPPRKKVVTTPPTTADRIPDIAGAPAAKAIPKESGKAIRETLIAAIRSL